MSALLDAAASLRAISVREVDLAFSLQPIAQTAFVTAAPSLVNLMHPSGDPIET